jgi:hypothetical protein
MNSPLAAGDIFEVLHCIRDVHRFARNSRLGKCSIEKFASRTNEWSAGEVFLITGLLAHKY